MTIEEAKQQWKEIPIGRSTNYTNQKFGKLTCLYRTENNSSGTVWVCKCECGNIKPFAISKLKKRQNPSCGCGCSLGLDLTGQRFGRLVALSKAPSRSGKTYWLCQCDCGNQKEIQTSHLVQGLIQSCGCLSYTRLDGTYGPRYCLNCGKKLNKNEQKYCSILCQNEYQRKQAVEKIFNGEDFGLKQATTSNPKIKDSLRTYLLKRAEYKCEKCGCDWINPYSNQTILEIHHIDGNRNNNLENNLQVLCPNCHAMTSNYKGLNKKRDK